MSTADLERDVAAGLQLWACTRGGEIVGVMGVQPSKDVFLIRHAYVRPDVQGHGVGAAMLAYVREQVEGQILIGTWEAATWAIRFYQKHGFRLVDRADTSAVLKKYWSIPDRQVATSVVLTNE